MSSRIHVITKEFSNSLGAIRKTLMIPQVEIVEVVRVCAMTRIEGLVGMWELVKNARDNPAKGECASRLKKR